ncbi:MAG: hypothetical protein R3212_01985 [Xanthomonadales bacterium]|nr:hypothetical protein [Xanthomonadales bacterium]
MNTRNSSNRNLASKPGRRVWRTFSLAMAGALVLSACATTGGGGGGSAVVERAEDRWDALIAGDFERAYGYYTPGFRSSQKLSDFELSMRLRKVRVSGVRYLEHECEEVRCTLQFESTYKVASPVPGIEVWEGKSRIEENWINTNGQWWYLPDD